MMRQTLRCGLLLSTVLSSWAWGIPPPCTEEELIATSDFAIEGYVVAVDCDEPYDSGECSEHLGNGDGFLPELVSDCRAKVKVTLSIKGDLAEGSEVEIPFLKLARACQDGIPLIPGSPKWDFRLNSKVRYYNSSQCAYSNFLEIEAPFIRGDPNGDGAIGIIDAASILLFLFQGITDTHTPSALDANGNGRVTLADVVYVLSYVFRHGPPPPDPFQREQAGVRVTIVYDNFPYDVNLKTDWGFSCLVENAECTLLVDSGRNGPLLLDNMAHLDVHPRDTDVVLFTHVHTDHIGGLGTILHMTPGAPVYIPESFPDEIRSDIATAGCTPVDVGAPVEVCEGIHSSGEMPAEVNEQFVHLRTGKGLLVITGCAHPGVIPIVEEAKRQTGEDVYLLLGGLHLHQADDDELRQLIASLRELGVKKVAPCHCSGERARELLKEEFGRDYIEVGVGARLSWGP